MASLRDYKIIVPSECLHYYWSCPNTLHGNERSYTYRGSASVRECQRWHRNVCEDHLQCKITLVIVWQGAYVPVVKKRGLILRKKNKIENEEE